MKKKIYKPVYTSKKIRAGDRVIAIAGDCKGQQGTVKSCKGDKIVVLGLNLQKKCIRKTQNTPGRIVEVERPIHVSNLKICPQDETGVKLKVRHNDNGQRQFVYVEGDQEVVYRSVKTPK